MLKKNDTQQKKLSVIEKASPDRIVTCQLHESGLIEIKYPWTHWDKKHQAFIIKWKRNS